MYAIIYPLNGWAGLCIGLAIGADIGSYTPQYQSTTECLSTRAPRAVWIPRILLPSTATKFGNLTQTACYIRIL